MKFVLDFVYGGFQKICQYQQCYDQCGDWVVGYQLWVQCICYQFVDYQFVFGDVDIVMMLFQYFIGCWWFGVDWVVSGGFVGVFCCFGKVQVLYVLKLVIGMLCQCCVGQDYY